MKRLLVIITARPSYSRIKGVLDILKNSKKVELVIVTTACANSYKYGKVSEQIKKDGFTICEELNTMIECDEETGMVKTVGMSLISLADAIKRIRPDAVLTIADRFETISNAIASSYMNIPLIHIQGGEETGSIDNRVRHAITKLADIHIVCTKKAKEYVISLHEKKENIYFTGCPSIDIAKKAIENKNKEKEDAQIILNSILKNRPQFLPPKYMIVMQHPDTIDHEESRKQVSETLKAIKCIDLPIFWFTPNTDRGSTEIDQEINNFEKRNFYLIKNLPTDTFIRFLNKCECLIGNSRVGIRESSFLGIPVINIGNRQFLRERSENVTDVPYNSKEILEAINKVKGKHYERSFVYGDGNSSKKIAEILENIEYKLKEGKYKC